MKEDDGKPKLSSNTEEFLENYLREFCGEQKRQLSDNAEINSAAVIYEKIRVAVEYQEEHLVFKNAIARIVRRKYTLLPTITPEILCADLIRELTWANYITPSTLDEEKEEAIKKIMERYLVILGNIRSGLYSKMELTKKVINWMACEIEDFIRPKRENEVLIKYAASVYEKNLDLNTKKIGSADSLILIKIAIVNLVFKPDLYSIEYFVLNEIYPNWKNYSLEEAKKFGRSFEPYYNKIDRLINHPFRANYLRYVKRYIPPFIILRTVLTSGNFNLETIKKDPFLLEMEASEAYKSLISSARDKVMRGTLRALIFVFLTKMTLAFIVEIPYENHFYGAVNYLALAVNILTPPLLMFISGTFIKSPPLKNAKSVADAIGNLLYQGEINNKKFKLIRNKRNSFALFNFVYGLFNLAILIAVIWLLIKIDFNIVSIVLFFFFVSAVSFFAFRIRNIALELAMERSSDDAITSSVEFIFLPFIKIGKHISAQFTAFNPFMLVLDFLIEAPLKVIIRIMNLWRGFVSSKKEDLEY